MDIYRVCGGISMKYHTAVLIVGGEENNAKISSWFYRHTGSALNLTWAVIVDVISRNGRIMEASERVRALLDLIARSLGRLRYAAPFRLFCLPVNYLAFVFFVFGWDDGGVSDDGDDSDDSGGDDDDDDDDDDASACAMGNFRLFLFICLFVYACLCFVGG
ncbi:hypothetical protein L873DRAFT_468925 [Choiromyces venosus 120613-1]|uniref:Uncharacterized protein n=1 Tax=Choiromyces venosus 120613-1 TaxID=1336337 RepID=A0A3N4IVV1_9PEZI|nr:hypothetical protein L873DRAFT_468925 [Choiromyces venosus 120613-1]